MVIRTAAQRGMPSMMKLKMNMAPMASDSSSLMVIWDRNTEVLRGWTAGRPLGMILPSFLPSPLPLSCKCFFPRSIYMTFDFF